MKDEGYEAKTPESCSPNTEDYGPCVKYLAELTMERRFLQNFPGHFYHVEKIVDEELGRVRSMLFYFESRNELQNLPEPAGEEVRRAFKLWIPIDEYPDFNFIGRMMGPHGMTNKQLEEDTGCRIMIRGRGSMRDKRREEENRGRPNWEHLNEPLHVLIEVKAAENIADTLLEYAKREVAKLLVPSAMEGDFLKRQQLDTIAKLKEIQNALMKTRGHLNNNRPHYHRYQSSPHHITPLRTPPTHNPRHSQSPPIHATPAAPQRHRPVQAYLATPLPNPRQTLNFTSPSSPPQQIFPIILHNPHPPFQPIQGNLVQFNTSNGEIFYTVDLSSSYSPVYHLSQQPVGHFQYDERYGKVAGVQLQGHEQQQCY